MKNKKKMKPGCLAGLIVGCVLVIGIVAAVIGFYPLIHSFFHGLFKAPDVIAAELSKSKEETARALKDSGISVSLDDLERAESGEMSEEEITEMIYGAMFDGQSGANDAAENKQAADGTQTPTTALPEGSLQNDAAKTDAPDGDNTAAVNKPEQAGKTDPDSAKQPDKTNDKSTPAEDKNAAVNTNKSGTGEKKTDNDKTKTSSPAGTKMTAEQVDRRVAELVAQVYVLKSQYTGLLGSFEASVKAQYNALPKEQHNAAGKAKIVSDNMSYVAGLESQCDAQMAAITAELTTLLTDNGRDTSLVNAINTAYVNEKELKKAYYVSLYK